MITFDVNHCKMRLELSRVTATILRNTMDIAWFEVLTSNYNRVVMYDRVINSSITR